MLAIKSYIEESESYKFAEDIYDTHSLKQLGPRICNKKNVNNLHHTGQKMNRYFTEKETIGQ